MGSGQPFDEVAKRRFLNYIESGDSIASAAKQLGFTPATARKHIKADREFAQAIADAVQAGDGEIQRKLRRAILEDDGNISGMFRWLERRQPHEWGDNKTIQHQHVGPGGGPIQVAVASTDSLRELLGDENYREKMLGVVRDIPMIEATATENE